jgi:hypothetical protein
MYYVYYRIYKTYMISSIWIFFNPTRKHSDVCIWDSNGDSIYDSSDYKSKIITEHNIANNRLISFLEGKVFSIENTMTVYVLIHRHFAKANVTQTLHSVDEVKGLRVRLNVHFHYEYCRSTTRCHRQQWLCCLIYFNPSMGIFSAT